MQIRPRALGLLVVGDGGFAVARRLGQAHVARDHGLVDLFAEEFAHLVHDLIGQLRAPVIHGHDDALYAQLRIEALVAHFDAAHEIGDALERVILALHRDEHAVGRDERIDRQQLERRRTVDEDEVIVRLHRSKRVFHDVFPLRRADELDRAAGEIHICRQHVAVFRAADTVGSGRAVHQQVVAIGRHGFVHAHAGGAVALWVAVDEEHAPPALFERAGQVHARRRLADPAFLVGDGNDFAHGLPP